MTFPNISSACTDKRISLNSLPKHPEFILIPPPTVPGMHERNSKPLRWFSHANSDNFLSDMMLPAIIISLLSIDKFEKFLPNLITAPSKVPSGNSTFEPAPKINIFERFLYIFKKLINSFKFSGLKKIFASPPILNQLFFF